MLFAAGFLAVWVCIQGGMRRLMACTCRCLSQHVMQQSCLSTTSVIPHGCCVCGLCYLRYRNLLSSAAVLLWQIHVLVQQTLYSQHSFVAMSTLGSFDCSEQVYCTSAASCNLTKKAWCICYFDVQPCDFWWNLVPFNALCSLLAAWLAESPRVASSLFVPPLFWR